MKAWDSDLEEERGEEGGEETSNGTAEKGEENGKGDDSQGHLQKVQKLIYAAKVITTTSPFWRFPNQTH